MGLYSPVMNEGYVPAYQISAIPYVSSSTISSGQIQEFVFPQVTRFINVQNVGTLPTDEIAVAFTRNGLNTANSNFFSLGQGVSFRDEFRTTRLFVSCSSGSNMRYQLVVGLTNIPANQFIIITGSDGYQGVG